MPLLPVLIALAQSAAPAPAQMPRELPSVLTSAMNSYFGCVGRGAKTLPKLIDADAGMKLVLADCGPERAAFDKQFDLWVNGPDVPPANRQRAREQNQQILDSVASRLAAAIATDRRNSAPGAAMAPPVTPPPGER